MRVSTTRPPSGWPGRRRVGTVGPPPQDGDRGEEHGLMNQSRRDEPDCGRRGRERYPDPAGKQNHEHRERRDRPLPGRLSRLRTEQAQDGCLPRITVAQRAEAHTGHEAPHTLNSCALAGRRGRPPWADKLSLRVSRAASPPRLAVRTGLCPRPEGTPDRLVPQAGRDLRPAGRQYRFEVSEPTVVYGPPDRVARGGHR